jgi:hypothetical protein
MQFDDTQEELVDLSIVETVDNSNKRFNCEWNECSWNDAVTVKDLAEHVETVHVHRIGDQHVWLCEWSNCARNQRPFSRRY